MADVRYFVSRVLFLSTVILVFFFVDFTVLSIIGRCLAGPGVVHGSAYFAFFMTVCWTGALFLRGDAYGI